MNSDALQAVISDLKSLVNRGFLLVLGMFFLSSVFLFLPLVVAIPWLCILLWSLAKYYFAWREFFKKTLDSFKRL